MNQNLNPRLSMPVVLLVIGAEAAGCNGAAGGRSRTPLDEVPGLARVELAGRLAEEGLSVGDIRSAVLPDGTTVALLTPQPSDGFTPQVTVVRLDGGVPNLETEAVCDPFLWTVNIDSTQFSGLDPAQLASVAWEDWIGNDRPDLVVDITLSTSADSGSIGSFDSSFRARCAFRPTDDPSSGHVAAAVFGWLAEATSNSAYSDTRTEITERHDVLPVPNEPEQLDYRITNEVLSCNPGPQGIEVCSPRTDITIRRYAAVGEGIELSYIPLEEAAYHYPTPDYGYDNGLVGPDCNDPAGCDDAVPGYDDTATGYDDTATGYDDAATGYDDTATGYDDTATGYDDTATGYDDTATGYDEEAAGADDPVVPE